jgi:murein L,D-transpeptidase YafK
MKRRYFLIVGYILLCLSQPTLGKNKNIWLLVDTKRLTLDIKQGEKTIESFKNIAIGRNGAGLKRRLGDDVTPKGSYTIRWINDKSHFYRFYGFDYPTVENAKMALSKKIVTKSTYSKIINAHKINSLPPQNTTLGGQIGIHGLGRASKRVHSLMNWTHGCIALTNEQIDSLNPWMSMGIKVIVK